jgi:Predicted nucleotide-binding protein containing TIR-like domain
MLAWGLQIWNCARSGRRYFGSHQHGRHPAMANQISKAAGIGLMRKRIGEIADFERDAGDRGIVAIAERGDAFFLRCEHLDQDIRETIDLIFGPESVEARLYSKDLPDFVKRYEAYMEERANMGQTVIEKFERNADVGFAIVLLTPDDVGGTDASSLQARARQNVILEFGYFIKHLGRERVVALRTGDIEMPSDILGVVVELIDKGGAWKRRLANELESAGYAIDWRKAMR